MSLRVPSQRRSGLNQGNHVTNRRLAGLAAATLLCLSVAARAQERAPTATPGLKEQMRLPWTRNDANFIRDWKIAGPFDCSLEGECAAAGEPRWQAQYSYDDSMDFDGLPGRRGDRVADAMATVNRAQAGKAQLTAGSLDGIRVWVNDREVLKRTAARSRTPDEDRVEVDLRQGANTVRVRTASTGSFSIRVLETGTLLERQAEIGPSLIEADGGFIVKTDIALSREAVPVSVEVVRPGGGTMRKVDAARGAEVRIDTSQWPEGPYDVRVSTRTARGLFYAAQLPWYQGDALARARELAAEAAKADATKPEGFTLRMLVNMVEDRVGGKLAEASGNPWRSIHSPLMEYEELKLERSGQTGRIRPFGFVRIGWIDEIDGSAQFCRAYLPPRYDAAQKWPTVLQLHGFNPANPVYWRWWSADNRGSVFREHDGDRGLIYIEPHGRNNTQYLLLGDADVLRCLAEAKKLLSVDDDRVYLTGDSMGGFGTWNVATRHPDLFAAIAPVFGGADYHSRLSEEQLAGQNAVERFWADNDSSWSMAESLINTPIYVHHGDADEAVPVEWSRYGVRLLQRWGYDVRYQEYPGRRHEALRVNNGSLNFDWFLGHERNPDPRQVRIRSAELRNAQAFWVQVRQGANPLEFMVVDAEVIDRNVIRLDTRNVLEVVLTPSKALVDTAKTVKVIWNGVAHELQGAELRLTDPRYEPAARTKTPELPGGGRDFYVTPFAVVIGTTARDPDMKELIRERANRFIDTWKDWQKQPPRVFLDTEISDADLGRYSLMLWGGPAENAVAARLAARLPVRLSRERIRIDGQDFEVRDAALQMVYPNPRNPARYVWLIAANSTNGMFLAEVTPLRVVPWDFHIVDGHIPAPRQAASQMRLAVVSGMFDHHWRYAEAFAVRGDAAIRGQGHVLRRPERNLVIDPRVLAAYSGRFQVVNGPLIEFHVADEALRVKVGNDDLEMLPVSERRFFLPRFNVSLEFVRGADGTVDELWGYDGEESLTATRVP
jgi:dienelactone hydrolase